MVNILPFQRTRLLISEIDDYLDKVSEAVLVLEQTIGQYLESGAGVYLDERVEQIMEVERRGDELRRNVSNITYSQMLMPDTRGDMLGLLDEVDAIMDASVHTVIRIAMERPELEPDFIAGFKSLATEATKAADTMLQGARAYFKEPHAVRDHVNKTSFHSGEATKMTLQLGKRVFDSELPLDRKRQLADLAIFIRRVASLAEDIGDLAAIYAVKRAL